MLYRASFETEAGALRASWLFLLANTLYCVEEYAALKDFYQNVNAKDPAQAILQFASSRVGQPPAAASTGEHRKRRTAFARAAGR